MEMIGGYRILRLLGEGARARVLLGVAARLNDGGADATADRIAALKVYRDTVSLASIDTEIEALARLSHRHVIELRDLATAPDGRPVLLFPRLGPPDLARMVAGRGGPAAGGLELGEIVTALAPIVGAVQELHRMGVAHGGIRLSSIMIDNSGAPVLGGFGRASIVGGLPDTDDGRSLSDAELGAHSAILDDVSRVAGLVCELLESMPRVGAQGRRVAELCAWLDGADVSVSPPTVLNELEERLFDLGPALALDLAGSAGVERDEGGSVWEDAEEREIPARLSLDALAAREPVTYEPAVRASEPITRRTGPLTAMLAERLDDDPLELLRTRVATLLAPVRAPVWVAGGCGAVALVVALMVLGGSGGSARGAAQTPAPTSSQSPAPTSSQSPAPTPAPSGAATTPPTTSEDAAAISGLEPVAATTALLKKRAHCFATRSESCLRSVDDPGSSAFDSDRGALASLGAEEPVPESLSFTAAKPELGERLGDSAIVHLTTSATPEDASSGKTPPASILVVRSEAGWRIRDLAIVLSGGG